VACPGDGALTEDEGWLTSKVLWGSDATVAVSRSRLRRSSVVGRDSSVGNRCGLVTAPVRVGTVELGHDFAVGGSRRVEFVVAVCELTALLCGVLFQLGDAPL
jgi:hypothetical protein